MGDGEMSFFVRWGLQLSPNVLPKTRLEEATVLGREAQECRSFGIVHMVSGVQAAKSQSALEV